MIVSQKNDPSVATDDKKQLEKHARFNFSSSTLHSFNFSQLLAPAAHSMYLQTFSDFLAAGVIFCEYQLS